MVNDTRPFNAVLRMILVKGVRNCLILSGKNTPDLDEKLLQERETKSKLLVITVFLQALIWGLLNSTVSREREPRILSG